MVAMAVAMTVEAVAMTPPSQLVAVGASQTIRCSATLQARRNPREAVSWVNPLTSALNAGRSP